MLFRSCVYAGALLATIGSTGFVQQEVVATEPVKIADQLQLFLDRHVIDELSGEIELQDASGQPIEGYTLGDSRELIGNEIERVVSWSGDSDIGELAGQSVRLRFVLDDADLYSFRFRQAE